jgi:DNA-binding MarR family transcriptional regulator
MIIDPLADYPGYLLRRVSVASMNGLARRLKALQLRPAEVAAPNMVPLIARLAGRGLIVRQAVDGRSHGLHLTEEGLTVARKAKKVMLTHEKALLARIPAVQRSAFLAALRALWSTG